MKGFNTILEMEKDEVYKEIKEMFGAVPSFFQVIPEKTLGEEWSLFKKIQIEKSSIPEKFRELIGIGISAATKCRYCSFFHTEMARLLGASEEEIEEAVHFAKTTTGWSTYINGLQIDFETFKKEIRDAVEYVKAHQEVHA